MLVPGLLVLLLPAVRITGTTRLPAPAALSRRATMSVTDTSTGAAPNVTEAAAALKGQLRAQAAPEVQVRGLDERIFALNRLLIGTVKGSIDAVYSYQDDGTLLQDVRRFYVLETVARVPYFAYLSVLHLRETLGERDLRGVMRLHYAEADNELHHLLVMESLGGNSTAFDRTLAKTMAFFYYWYVVGVYALSPEAAYHLSELIEDHAFQTYDNFLGRRGAELQGLPVPRVAREYYEADDKFLFDLVSQSCRTDRIDIADGCPRRPNLQTLYDVFVCIRNDEKEHWESLCTLVQRGSFDDEGDSPIQSTEPEQVESTGPELSPLALASSAAIVGVAVAMALVA
jgi:ubiquinol oxidase